jgi:hypothetical protein
MPGFQPLIIVDGQIESLGDRQLEVKKLNIGGEEIINVTSDTVTVTRSNHFLENANSGVQQVDTILGGDEGDLLLLKGNDIRLRTNGNLQMSSNYRLEPGRSIVFIHTGGDWLELARKNT